MIVEPPHPWPTDPQRAVELQDRLRPLADHTGPGPARPALVAGVDVAYGGDGSGTADRVAAAVVVLDGATGEPVDAATAVGRAGFPYVPGLFAFRELPVLVEALNRLDAEPELILCDGQGLAHPRRFGLACHLGVISGVPTAGVAKTPFVGAWDAERLGPERGSWVPLTDGDEVVGRALRTRTGVRPVFVSTGHLIDLDTACRNVLALATRYRLPETTRLADRLSRQALAAGTSPRPPGPGGAPGR